MKKLMTLLLATAIFASCTTGDGTKDKAEVPQEKKVLPYDIKQATLDNGLNVVTVPYESPGLAAFYIVVRVGSREEVEEGKTGFAHFFEHMMFRGTDNYTKEEYDEVLKTVGAAANANTWLDRTVYHMSGNAEMLDKMFMLEADRFMNLKYSEADFKVEAGAVKGEYTKNFASAFRQINEKIVETAFDNHTYKHTTMGFFEDIKDMPNQFDYSLEFYDRFYRPEYTTIIVVGDVTPAKVESLAKEYFGKWERGSYKAEIPVEPEQKGTRYTHIEDEGFTPMLFLNYRGPGFSDTTKDVAAMEIISTMLLSKRSDLYQKLVVEEQKALSLFPYFFYTRDPYLFSVGATTSNADNLVYINDEVRSELEKLKTEMVDDKLLEDTKSHIKYSFAMGIDNPDDIAESLSYFTWLTGDPESLNRYYAILEEITAEDIMKAANRYFNNDQLTIGTVSPKAEGGIK